MSKIPQALLNLSPSSIEALKSLGENLRIARRRRNETLDSWAAQLGVSIPTLMRLEQGSPSTSIGLFVAALSLLGREGVLPDLADPRHDVEALKIDVNAALERQMKSTERRRRR